MDELGIEAIRARNVALTERLIERCQGRRLLPPGRRVRLKTRSAIVPVRHPAPADAVKQLADRGIIVDSRPGVVRASPHFYNTSAEVDAFVEALAGTV